MPRKKNTATEPTKLKKSFVISASLATGCYRHIQIMQDATLEELSGVILWAFAFDNDHAHAFFMDNVVWSGRDCYYFDMVDRAGEYRHTCDYDLKEVMTVGSKFKYLFDFGDEWRFSCKVLREAGEVVAGGLDGDADDDGPLAKVIREVGEPPQQYPEWEDDDGDDDDDDYVYDDEWVLAQNADASHGQQAIDKNNDASHGQQIIKETVSSNQMLTNAIYDLAFQFKRTKLWQKLNDSELFAVKHSDGTIGYCCVMGMSGEHLALAVYPGDAGLYGYRLIEADASRLSELEDYERMFSQDCVMVSFEVRGELRPREVDAVTTYCQEKGITLRGKNAYPQLKRFRPHYYPWYVDDEVDLTHLREALEAALAVSEKLTLIMPQSVGFTEGMPFDRAIPLLTKDGGAFTWGEMPLPKPKPIQYPSPKIEDDISKARLAKAKKRGGDWAIDVFMHLQPIAEGEGDGEFVDEPTSAPFFPYVLLMVDVQSGMVIGTELTDEPDDYAETFIRAILDVVLKLGKPARILVTNERAHALVERFCAQMGVKLLLKRSVPELEEAEDGFFDHYDGEDGLDLGEVEPLMEMLHDQSFLSELPDEELAQLLRGVQMGVLPADVAKLVMAEYKRRK